MKRLTEKHVNVKNFRTVKNQKRRESKRAIFLPVGLKQTYGRPCCETLVCGFSGCGSLAKRKNISPNPFQAYFIVFRDAGSEITCTCTLAGFTVKAKVAARSFLAELP